MGLNITCSNGKQVSSIVQQHLPWRFVDSQVHKIMQPTFHKAHNLTITFIKALNFYDNFYCSWFDNQHCLPPRAYLLTDDIRRQIILVNKLFFGKNKLGTADRLVRGTWNDRKLNPLPPDLISGFLTIRPTLKCSGSCDLHSLIQICYLASNCLTSAIMTENHKCQRITYIRQNGVTIRFYGRTKPVGSLNRFSALRRSFENFQQFPWAESPTAVKISNFKRFLTEKYYSLTEGSLGEVVFASNYVIQLKRPDPPSVSVCMGVSWMNLRRHEHIVF